MLPTKVFQLDYQDFSNLVWNHIPKIEEYQKQNNLVFDIVIAKLRNGVLTGSILSNYFGLPMGVIEAPRGRLSEDFRLFWPLDLEKSSKVVNILLVDSICGTGQTLNDLISFLKANHKNVNVTSYVTLVDEKSPKKPDIVGELKKDYIQPPWEWISFTPQSHLQRLEAGHIKASLEREIFVGFSSDKCKSSVEDASGKIIDNEWLKVFHNFANDENLAQAVSGISSINKDAPTSFISYKTKFKKIISEKVDFILSNGVSHFIEDNLEEALLISQDCPVTHVFFFDGQTIHKVYSRRAKLSEIKLN